jgi:hypothetical protein
MRNAHKILVEKCEGKRPFIRPRRKLEDNLKWIVGKKCLRVWIGLIWLRIGIGGGHL